MLWGCTCTFKVHGTWETIIVHCLWRLEHVSMSRSGSGRRWRPERGRGTFNIRAVYEVVAMALGPYCIVDMAYGVDPWRRARGYS